MKRIARVAMSCIALVMAARAMGQDDDVPPAIDHCVLTAAPARYHQQTVNVRAVWRHSDRGEWLMEGQCFRPVLISLRDEASSRPAFAPSRTAALDEFTRLSRLP